MDHRMLFNAAMAMLVPAAVVYIIHSASSRKPLRIAGDALLFIAVSLSLAGLVLRGLHAGHAPFSNTYETMLLMSFALPCIYAFFIRQDSARAIGAAVAVLSVILIAATSFMDNEPRPLVPALKSNWLAIHVMFSFISYAAFAVAFAAGIVFFARDGKDTLPDKAAYKSILLGYPFLTLGIATGAVWANTAWGTYWSWDPKETWALITWIVYGIYLHLRLNRSWQGARSSAFAIAAFFFVIFTYFGVNYLLGGLHSYR